jgi:hypothetical protein
LHRFGSARQGQNPKRDASVIAIYPAIPRTSIAPAQEVA